jgi:hypothetical protein
VGQRSILEFAGLAVLLGRAFLGGELAAARPAAVVRSLYAASELSDLCRAQPAFRDWLAGCRQRGGRCPGT